MAREKVPMGKARLLRLDEGTEKLFLQALAAFREKMPLLSEAAVLRALVRSGAELIIARSNEEMPHAQG